MNLKRNKTRSYIERIESPPLKFYQTREEREPESASQTIVPNSDIPGLMTLKPVRIKRNSNIYVQIVKRNIQMSQRKNKEIPKATPNKRE